MPWRNGCSATNPASDNAVFVPAGSTLPKVLSVVVFMLQNYDLCRPSAARCLAKIHPRLLSRQTAAGTVRLGISLRADQARQSTLPGSKGVGLCRRPSRADSHPTALSTPSV